MRKLNSNEELAIRKDERKKILEILKRFIPYTRMKLYKRLIFNKCEIGEIMYILNIGWMRIVPFE